VKWLGSDIRPDCSKPACAVPQENPGQVPKPFRHAAELDSQRRRRWCLNASPPVGKPPPTYLKAGGPVASCSRVGTVADWENGGTWPKVVQ
jgi:hypothetical protein